MLDEPGNHLVVYGRTSRIERHFRGRSKLRNDASI
jgi:hypothetical protein